jgi:pyroglutamyl-peptidase
LRGWRNCDSIGRRIGTEDSAMTAKRVVLTGYEPWSHASENPTLELLDRAAARNYSDIELVTLRVPVESDKIAPLVNEALDEYKPDVWISLGLFPGSSVVSVERTAANVKDFPVPDNVGAQPLDEPVFADGPFAYQATIPIKAIVEAIRKRDIPVKVSNSASTYLCNQIMYSTLHLARQKRLDTRAGFIHVPCSPRYVANAPYGQHEFPSMSLDLMSDAVDAAITTATARHDDIKAPPTGY